MVIHIRFTLIHRIKARWALIGLWLIRLGHRIHDPIAHELAEIVQKQIDVSAGTNSDEELLEGYRTAQDLINAPCAHGIKFAECRECGSDEDS